MRIVKTAAAEYLVTSYQELVVRDLHMRPVLAVAAIAFTAGGTPPAALILLAAGAVHVVRSPVRLLDTIYALAFVGLGALAGSG